MGQVREAKDQQWRAFYQPNQLRTCLYSGLDVIAVLEAGQRSKLCEKWEENAKIA